MLSASSMPLLPRSTRKLELLGLRRMLQAHLPARLVIAGGPRAGKTTLTKALGEGRVLHLSDDVKHLGWSESSLAASHWLDERGPWICEGVAMARALRKWLARNPTGSPADLIVHLTEPIVPRKRGQHVMALGCHTVMSGIADDLRARGVTILEF